MKTTVSETAARAPRAKIWSGGKKRYHAAVADKTIAGRPGRSPPMMVVRMIAGLERNEHHPDNDMVLERPAAGQCGHPDGDD